ncbi:WD40-repeat-containing domain protein [Fimicolochytrium jonesii]|uniref:WD40-repeat-containing domain protein n=1 Tax=Fimicolochytrium jonesii TaxID=1396493 RepID=UPI0022FDEC03|nr:WD40-repeat-containing domain protein [Fimicolochytrium jonesii]KAI8821110.1 WD40-repeat-containing domain protein [Fimicolochytrium jonesii]
MLPSDRRKDELEKKRAKLAEIRKAKEARKIALDAQRRDPVDTLSRTTSRRDVDSLVASLVGERSSVADDGSDAFRSMSPSPLPSLSEIRSPGSVVGATGGENVVEAPPQPNLSSVDFVFFDCPPKEKVMYTKEIQTDFVNTDWKPEEKSTSPTQPTKPRQLPEETSPTTNGSLSDSEEKIKPVQPPRELSEEERKEILSSEPFLTFFDHSARVLERALNQPSYDFLKDYTVADEVHLTGDGKGIKLHWSYADERWTRNRAVMDTRWSQKHPELFLGAYGKNQGSVTEADGVVLIWNLHLREQPEYVFQSQSDVTVATFSDFHPNLVVGGAYSGQILVWDMRAKSLPVLKSPLSAVGHTHPVYSMNIIGTQNAHNLLTASTDGLVCSWQLDMLARPQEALDLIYPSSARADGVSITTMSFPPGETTTFWVGTEEGMVYQANRYDRAGSKAGINANDVFKGHFGPVTGIDFHPMSGPADFSDLFLTSSVDWTVKLWRAKSVSKTSATPQVVAPLNSFEEADDYVYDVKWSPTHPSLFGCVDGAGKFDIYNLNQDVEVPIVRIPVGSGGGLNKLAWDKEGQRTAIGSADGQIHVYDLGEIAQPRPDEWHLFQKTLAEMESR